MRNSISIGLFWLLLACSPKVFGEEKIEWLRSAQEAAEVASRLDRPILVYVRSANCHYCDLMQRDVWQDQETVARINREFVPLKLTNEENAEAVEVMQVEGFPSTLVFSADRKFIHRVKGYLNPKKLKGELDKAQRATMAARLSQRK